jgi:hypothetical protein
MPDRKLPTQRRLPPIVTATLIELGAAHARLTPLGVTECEATFGDHRAAVCLRGDRSEVRKLVEDMLAQLDAMDSRS